MTYSLEKKFDSFSVEPEFRMRWTRTRNRRIDSATQRRIETLWEREQRDLGDALFDGAILSVVEASPEELVGYFASYKQFVACQRDSTIAEALGIQAVAVTGVTSLDGCGSILVGRRSRSCLQDRSCFELLPSGGIDDSCCCGDRVLFEKQLFRELEEETGLGRELVRSAKPYLLTFDREREIWELCLDVVVAKEAETEVRCRRSEHQELLWLPRRDIVPFLKMHRGLIVGLTEYLLLQRPAVGMRPAMGRV